MEKQRWLVRCLFGLRKETLSLAFRNTGSWEHLDTVIAGDCLLQYTVQPGTHKPEISAPSEVIVESLLFIINEIYRVVLCCRHYLLQEFFITPLKIRCPRWVLTEQFWDPDSRSQTVPREKLQSKCQSHSQALTDRMVMEYASHNLDCSWLSSQSTFTCIISLTEFLSLLCAELI